MLVTLVVIPRKIELSSLEFNLLILKVRVFFKWAFSGKFKCFPLLSLFLKKNKENKSNNTGNRNGCSMAPLPRVRAEI